MKPGVGAGKFLGDLHNGLGDEEMRKRWSNGDYGKGLERPRSDYVAGWRKLAGRA